MGCFGVIDYILMGLYLAVLIGLAIYLKGKASESIEDYFIGGRKMPWWLLGISGTAQFVDIAGTALIISLLFIMGPKALFIEIRGGICIHMAVVMLWTGKWHRRSGCITGAEWSIFRFGSGPSGQASRIVTAIAVPIFIIGMVTYLSVAVGIFFSMFLPLSPMWCSLIIIGIACTYTAMSGFYGVVFTDLIQSGIIIAASIVITVMALGKTWGGEGFPALAEQVSGMSNWMSAVPSWKSEMPAGYENYKFIYILAMFYLFKAVVIDGFGSGGDPKFFGARNDRECGMLTLMWTSLMTVRWPLMIGCAVLGIYFISQKIPDQSVLNEAAVAIKTEYVDVNAAQWKEKIFDIQKNPEKHSKELIGTLKGSLGDDWQGKLMLTNYDGGVNGERLLPVVIINMIPNGLKGLILIALLAACMSTFDSNVNFAVGFLTRDLYQAYARPKATQKELIRASWFFTFLIGIIGFIFSLNVQRIEGIWGFLMMGLGLGFMVPGFIKFYWARYNGWGFAGGMIAGMLCAIFMKLFDFNLGSIIIDGFGLDCGDLEGFIRGDVGSFITVALFGIIGVLVGTLTTKPTDHEVSKHFFLKTKPFGSWGKFHKYLDEETLKTMKAEHRNDLISLPFAVVWHFMLMLLPIQLVLGNLGAEFAWSISIFIVCSVALYFFWFRNLPKENKYED